MGQSAFIGSQVGGGPESNSEGEGGTAYVHTGAHCTYTVSIILFRVYGGKLWAGLNKVKERMLTKNSSKIERRTFSYNDVLTVKENIVEKSSDQKGPDIIYKNINKNDYAQVWGYTYSSGLAHLK